MSSIIELRKQELAGQISALKSGIEQVISTNTKYDLLKGELQSLQTKLDRIWKGFNPESKHPEQFFTCIEELKELEREGEGIRRRGEAEKRRLHRNATSARYAGTWASILATLGGIALGLGGCVSCMSNGTFQPPDSNGPHIDIPLFNLITGLLIGVVGGAAIGALAGALMGQMSERQSGDSSIGIWLPIAGLAILTFFGFWMLILNKDDRRINPTGGFFIISECNTPCRMEVGDPKGQYFNTDHKIVLVKFNGKKEWVRYGDLGDQGVSSDKYNTGMAEFISAENAPSVRVQVLRKR